MTNVLTMQGNPVPEPTTRNTVMRKLRSECIIRTEHGRLNGIVVGRYFKEQPFYMVRTSKGVFHDVTEERFSD